MTTELYNQRIRPYTPRGKKKRASPTGNACWGYIRVSTDKQVDGTSIESQELAIKAELEKNWSTTHGLHAIIRDVEPGGKTRFDQRKGGKELLSRMEAGDVLIISKVDRFSRSVVDGLQEMRELWRKGIIVVCLDMGGQPVTFGDNGEIMLFCLLLGAQMENKRRSERAKESWAREKAKGIKRKTNKTIISNYGHLDGKVDYNWRAFTIRLRQLYLFACEKLGYSKCDSRHLKLASRYGLVWWKGYGRTGPFKKRADVIPAEYFLRWFKAEDELNKKDPYAGPDGPGSWERDFAAGTLKPDPKPLNNFHPINTPGEDHVGTPAPDRSPDCGEHPGSHDGQ